MSNKKRLRIRSVEISAEGNGAVLGEVLRSVILGVGERQCRECGCTDLEACDGGCWWVEEDLCSACQS